MDGSERRLTWMFLFVVVIIAAAIGMSFWWTQPAVGDCVRLTVHPYQPRHSYCGVHYVIHGRLQERLGGDRVRMRLDRFTDNALRGQIARACEAASPPSSGECFKDDLSPLTGDGGGLREYCLGKSIELPAYTTIQGIQRRTVNRALDANFCAPLDR